MNVKKDIRFRVYIAFTAICLFGALIIVRAGMIQATEGEELRKQSRMVAIRRDTLLAERGNIYTETGDLLCSSIPQFDISLDLTVVKPDTFKKYIAPLSRGIADILKKKTAAQYQAELTKAYKSNKRYYPLCRNISYTQYQLLRTLPIFNKGKRRGGFIAEAETKRIYPYAELAKRTIGRWKAGTRPLGLEAAYDSLLAGYGGSRMTQKMTGGMWMPIEGSEIEARNGYDIVTTIDLDIQNVAEHAMMSMLTQYQCLNGTCIVMEVKTGKIKAMVNLGRDSATGRYVENQNYALQRAEPGSTFKLMTLMALLEDGYINVDDEVNCEGGAHDFGARVMHDSHHGLGVMPIYKAYAQSSNVAMGKLAFQHYSKDPQKFVNKLREFGIDEKTGIDLRGETAPHVLYPGHRDWNPMILPWMATGYGILITPLRTCMMYNAIANDGKLMKPYLVSAIREYGKDVQRFEPVMIKQIADSSTVRQLKKCTQEVVLSGTGKHIKSPFYSISGKTGTAQVADRIGGRWYGYRDGVYQGSFVGYFPSEKPQYTMMVMIRTRPHSGAYYGGTIASPVFRMIADRIFANSLGSWKGPLDSLAGLPEKPLTAMQANGIAYQHILTQLNLKPAKEIAQSNELALLAKDTSGNMVLRKSSVYKGQVPDVTGMSLKDAVYILENEGLRVKIQGSGRISAQSMEPGTRIAKGQTIILQLS